MILFFTSFHPSMSAGYVPPTPAQAEAGNYAKPRITWQGLTIAIENPAGSIRFGADCNGRALQDTMAHPYGYFMVSMGVDSDPVDVYVGPEPSAPMVYVVHQRRVGDWLAYDEDKVMICFGSEDEARQAFLQHYTDPRFLGPITAMPVAEFVGKLRATRAAPKMIKAVRR